MQNFITANWPAPVNINAFTTTRQGGYSNGTYSSFNLAAHVEDDPHRVEKNRQLLKQTLLLPNEPAWLQQTHCDRVIAAEKLDDQPADGSYTRQPKTICTVMTADCLPILICNTEGNEVAALHAGWRGIANGIIEAGIRKLRSAPENLLVWFGPAMGPQSFEVRADVRDIFIKAHPDAHQAFQVKTNESWLANIYLLAQQRLNTCGITQIYGGEYCTYQDAQLFYSYRRDKTTGRMASIIWFT